MRYYTKRFEKEQVTLTGYLHEGGSGARPRPAVLVLPGGGYYMCSYREGEPIALAYLAEGYHTFVLRYSADAGITFADAYEDAVLAMKYIKEQAQELGVDPQRIVAAGFSAGGHLAAALGTMGKTEAPRALILGYPRIFVAEGEKVRKKLPNIYEKVTPETPPAFIFATANDPVVPVGNSLKFAEALSAQKVEFELHIYREGNHALSLAKSWLAGGKKDMVNPAVAEWFGESLRWLKEVLGDFM